MEKSSRYSYRPIAVGVASDALPPPSWRTSLVQWILDSEFSECFRLSSLLLLSLALCKITFLLEIDAGDTVVAEHLSKCARNETYSSKATQNDIIDILDSIITEKVVARVNQAKFFAVISYYVQDALQYFCTV